MSVTATDGTADLNERVELRKEWDLRCGPNGAAMWVQTLANHCRAGPSARCNPKRTAFGDEPHRRIEADVRAVIGIVDKVHPLLLVNLPQAHALRQDVQSHTIRSKGSDWKNVFRTSR